MINWENVKWNESLVSKLHGDIYTYRDIYKGKHAIHFERAQQLIQKGEITDRYVKNTAMNVKVRTPYIVLNISKLVAETPAMLVSRSIGKITSSLANDSEQKELINDDTDELIEGAEEGKSSEVNDVQNELIRQIEKNSKLQLEHFPNIVQHQVDGGLVGVPRADAKGLRIEFKSRDVYYPHEDDLGADLVYHRTFNEKDYLHVYRERIQSDDLKTSNMLFELEGEKLTPVSDEEARNMLGIKELSQEYKGRSRLFIQYWPNGKTFLDPLGVSCLDGHLAHQDEINWRLTRNALVFERNSTPRLAITSEIFSALEDAAVEQFGEAGRGFIDHEMLEVVTMDENGKSMEVIQVDVKNIGGVEWANELIKEMLIATRTSQKAIDFYSENNNASAVSGVAKFYDLFVSIAKAEQLQSEYVYFLKQLFESCLWLANHKDAAVLIEEPDIGLNNMVPVNQEELIEKYLPAYEAGAMSLETFVRKTNPTASEEWIQSEIERIEMEKQTIDSVSILSGPQTAGNLNDNRDLDGSIIEEEEG